ncbi:MAG: hypothetical protein NVS3B20_04400 [Polyangiales bacterium]
MRYRRLLPFYAVIGSSIVVVAVGALGCGTDTSGLGESPTQLDGAMFDSAGNDDAADTLPVDRAVGGGDGSPNGLDAVNDSDTANDSVSETIHDATTDTPLDATDTLHDSAADTEAAVDTTVEASADGKSDVPTKADSADSGVKPDFGACKSCAASACSSQISACSAQAVCSKMLSCVAACLDLACGLKCLSDAPSAAGDAVFACAGSSCASCN